MKASFKNPLPHELTNGKFRISGPSLRKIFKSKLEEILPGAEASCKISDIPKVKGISSIIVKFDSNELHGVEGFLPIKTLNSSISATRSTTRLTTNSTTRFSSSTIETLETSGSRREVHVTTGNVHDLKMRLFNNQ